MRLFVCLAEAAASVYQAVSQLRKILGDAGDPPTYIATVPRKGYRLVAPARRVLSKPHRRRRRAIALAQHLLRRRSPVTSVKAR